MSEEITTLKLFKELEELRLATQTTIDNAAFVVGVTPLAYKNWKNHGSIPKPEMEPRLREAIWYFNLLKKEQGSE